jgi:hypothetical protein
MSILADETRRALAFYCELKLRDGECITLIHNPLDAQDHPIRLHAAYRAFVQELHEGLRAARSRTRFRAGMNLRQLVYECYWNSWKFQGFGYVFIWPRDFSTFRRNFPRRYRPTKVPERLLPPP